MDGRVSYVFDQNKKDKYFDICIKQKSSRAQVLVKGAWWKVWSYPPSGNENQRFVGLSKTETLFP